MTPSSTSASRWKRAVLGWTPRWSAISDTPTGAPARWIVSSTCWRRSLILLALQRLRREPGHQRGVGSYRPELRRAARAAQRGVETQQDFCEEAGVVLDVRDPPVRHIVLVVDRLDRAHRLAGAAVDALVGVDVERAAAL